MRNKHEQVFRFGAEVIHVDAEGVGIGKEPLVLTFTRAQVVDGKTTVPEQVLDHVVLKNRSWRILPELRIVTNVVVEYNGSLADRSMNICDGSAIGEEYVPLDQPLPGALNNLLAELRCIG